ncbi:MAG: DNA translocase FtsK 4TM domain-containing protein, partial [Bacteroidia bacterium]|nr:DNA translocase FtsK 4TM domain-containing protein [Bacteroidia bacterium]
MAGKGNRLKEPIVKQEAEEAETGVEEKPVKKIRQKKEKVQPAGPAPFIRMMQDDKTHRIAGLFLLLISVYLLIAFTSYFFTWKNDQSLVNGSWLDLIIYSDKKVDNWLGKLGAIVSHQFIFSWFGLAAYSFVLLSFLGGFKILFKAALMPLKKTFYYSIFTLLFIPPSLSFLFSGKPDLLFLGGGLGYQLNLWLSLSIGKVGTGFLLAFTGLSFLVAAFNLEFKLPGKKQVPGSAEDPDEEIFSRDADDISTGNRLKEDLISETELSIDLPDQYAHRDEIETAPLALTDEPAFKAPVPELHLLDPVLPPAEMELEVSADEDQLQLEIESIRDAEVAADGDLQVVNAEDT